MQPGLIGEREIAWLPPRARAYAARVLQGGEEFVPQKRVAVTAERIPLQRIELFPASFSGRLHQNAVAARRGVAMLARRVRPSGVRYAT